MKIKSDYQLHTIGSEFVVVAVGQRTRELNGMIRLNETGAFLWRQLEKPCAAAALVQGLMAEYPIDLALAQEAVTSFLQQLEEADLLVP